MIFLGYIMRVKGIKIDEEKVKVMQLWQTPITISKVQSIHGLFIFYRCFVKDFSTITTSPIDYLKERQLVQTDK